MPSETENELIGAKDETRQAQQQADTLEKRWRLPGMRRQMEEWVRLKGLAQGLVQAEQHVNQAYQHQEKIRLVLVDARNDVKKYGAFIGGSAFVALFTLIACLFFGIVGHNPVLMLLLLFIALVAIGVAWLNWKKFSTARENEVTTDKQMQEAINRGQMMVVAHDTARRVGGNNIALLQSEQEIRSLGGIVPRSLEEGQVFLQQNPDQGESLLT